MAEARLKSPPPDDDIAEQVERAADQWQGACARMETAGDRSFQQQQQQQQQRPELRYHDGVNHANLFVCVLFGPGRISHPP
jgi:hypothetical protein